MIKALRIPIKKLKDKELESIRDRVTTLKDELGYLPKIEDVKKCICEGFIETLGIELKKSELTEYESNLFNKRINFFRSPEWIFEVRKPAPSAGGEVYGYRRAEGGLIKTTLYVDLERQIIESTLITGDFFLYPSTALYDLEALLKHVKIDLKELTEIILNFFNTRNIQMPGVSATDFVQAMEDAIKKVTYTDLGFTLKESNEIFTVNTSLKQFIEQGADVLLLPYCAKHLSCHFRKKDGCTLCGLCTIGDAYKLAYQYGLKPMTIVSYEHLEETLAKLEKENIKGYIGCCCEAFYTKHQTDFEKFNIPGLLIDIEQTTCYDLGLEKAAYKGNFENQTDVNLDLLKKVLDLIKMYQTKTSTLKKTL